MFFDVKHLVARLRVSCEGFHTRFQINLENSRRRWDGRSSVVGCNGWHVLLLVVVIASRDRTCVNYDAFPSDFFSNLFGTEYILQSMSDSKNTSDAHTIIPLIPTVVVPKFKLDTEHLYTFSTVMIHDFFIIIYYLPPYLNHLFL